MLNVGGNSVQLVHPTWAPLAGALLNGGKIQGGMSGLKLLPATAGNGTTISGLSGKITGNVYSDNATVYAVDMNTFEEGQIEMTGVVDGSGDFYNVAFTGFLRGAALDDSKGTVKTYSTMGGTSPLTALTQFDLSGTLSGTVDTVAKTTSAGLYDQNYVYGGIGGVTTTKPINAVMKIILEEYAPVAGDSFNLFNTGTWGTQFGKGNLSYGANFALDFNAAPLTAGLAWQVEQTPDYLRIFIPGGRRADRPGRSGQLRGQQPAVACPVERVDRRLADAASRHAAVSELGQHQDGRDRGLRSGLSGFGSGSLRHAGSVV